MIRRSGAAGARRGSMDAGVRIGTMPDPRADTSGIVLACPCGEVYELRPEYAGRLLECAACGRPLRAGSRTRVAGDVDHGFDRDIFLLRERLLTISLR